MASQPDEVVWDIIGQVPPGLVTTYGDVAGMASDRLDHPITARTVGRLMGSAPHDLPWWRVVGHDGRLPPGLVDEAARHLRAEGCPMRGMRADVRRARWLG